ncbi:MAG: polysaccharide deacetylase family protein [Pseudomonadota bacterium]|nr:polysaccharide deacetylase family protein [Pseudomonadota bacterium]
MIAAFALSWPVPALAGLNDGAVVLVYHRIGADREPGASLSLDQFRANIALLTGDDIQVLPLSEILDRLDNGKSLPPRTVALTFDEACRSFWDVAWPILKEAGLPVTLFVTTGKIDAGGPDMMDWDDVRKAVRAGVVVGLHPAGELDLTRAGGTEIAMQLNRAETRLVQETGIKTDLFAFHNGESVRLLRWQLQKRGYRAAFGQHSGVVHADVDRLFLPRFNMIESTADESHFKMAVEALPLPVHDIVPSDSLIADNPPGFGFTVDSRIRNLGRLACFASGQGRARVVDLGMGRVEVRFSRSFDSGSTPITCTLPVGDGRWRWFGYRFLATGNR